MKNWKYIVKRYCIIMGIVLISLFAYVAWNTCIPSHYIDDERIYSRLQKDSDFGVELRFSEGGWVKIAIYSAKLSFSSHNSEAYLLFSDGCRWKLEFLSQLQNYEYDQIREIEPCIRNKRILKDKLKYIFANPKIVQDELGSNLTPVNMSQ